MDHLAAADTWGISGPAFLGLYVLAAVVAVTIAALGRRGSGPRADGAAHPTLMPVEVAYLREGGRLAVATAMGALYAAHTVDSKGRPTKGRATVTMTKDSVEQAVLTHLLQAEPATARRVSYVAAVPGVKQALAELRQSLAARGLARTPAQARTACLWALLPWAVVVLGIARAAAGHAAGKPIAFLVILVVITTAVAVVQSMPATLGQPPAARAAVARVREQNQHLDPALRPSWSTYGAAGAGMSIALFGAAAMIAADPAFASAVEMKTAASGGGGDGGSGCGGGSSCGGGGCGGGGCGG